MPSTLLFLCTGNYYRSRFAELYFNARAEEAGLDWRAESSGLATDRPHNNEGPLSNHAIEQLARYGVNVEQPQRYPQQVQEGNLAAAELIIALKETEHRPLLAERFPLWQDRVVYWHIHDLNVIGADEAMSGLVAELDQLLQQLA